MSLNAVFPYTTVKTFFIFINFCLNNSEIGNNHKKSVRENFTVWKVDAIRSNTAPFLGIASLDSVSYELENAILYFQQRKSSLWPIPLRKHLFSRSIPPTFTYSLPFDFHLFHTPIYIVKLLHHIYRTEQADQVTITTSISVLMTGRTPITPLDNFRGCPQTPQVKSGIIIQTSTGQYCYTYLPIHYPLVVLTLAAIQV